MKKLNVELDNCYGIKKLTTIFDFSKAKAFAIYAPNGAMKSSFARTFQDVAKGTASGDRIFTARPSKRSITDEHGVELPATSVLVVQPYDEVFGHSEKTSTLLVNSELRIEYEKLHEECEAAKDLLLKALKAQSGSKKDLEKEISGTFTKSVDQLKFLEDPKKRIASIPFMRNLLEFTKGEQDGDYIKLTSLLHWKNDSATISQSDLCGIYNALFGTALAPADGQEQVIGSMYKLAAECLADGEGMNFENKIVLSIAVRLKAEEYMALKINDQAFVDGITASQTGKLLSKFRSDNKGHAALKTLDKVMLMTPENIHLNAFMYEPILDMSDEHLRKLYIEVSALT